MSPTPGAAIRIGFSRFDLGLYASSSGARASFRREFSSTEGTTRSTFMTGAALSFGVLRNDTNAIKLRGVRAGIEVPILYGIDFGGLYEVWIGARAGGGLLRANELITENAEVNLPDGATGGYLRAGLLGGFAAGFRRIHAFVELSVDYERDFIAGQNAGYFIVLPSFGLRYRI